MSKPKSVKTRLRHAGFEPKAPRCALCRHYRKKGLHLIDSLPRFHRARCVLLEASLDSGDGLCDLFADAKTGEELQ